MIHPKIAIHHMPGSFSDRWLEFCRNNHVDHLIIDCHDSNIVSALRKFDILLWHWLLYEHADVLTAIPIIRAAEKMGLVVFPDVNTCCTYDNKVAQKYLLESVGAPVVPTQVFVDRSRAHEWAINTDYPRVFKLSKGAGAMNVTLVRNAQQARHLIDRSFGKGFKVNSGQVRENLARLRHARTNVCHDLMSKFKRLPSTIANIRSINRAFGREIGYIYFQDFVAGNSHDTRVTVIGDKAFAFRRAVRPGDFRASGSGILDYDASHIGTDVVQLAFSLARELSAQSIAFDFVRDKSSKPLICEISYCYVASAVYECPGYWDEKLEWHEEHVWPQDLILKECIKQYNGSDRR